MIYSEFPQGVKDLIKKRVEEQGNRYSEDVFIKRIGAGKHSGGFSWEDTEENFDFWKQVLSHGNLEVFYNKHPRLNPVVQSDQYYKQIPKDVKKGDFFEVAYKQAIAGETDYFRFKTGELERIQIGDVLQLVGNDGSEAPIFKNSRGKTHFCDWGVLKPTLKRHENLPMTVEEGIKEKVNEFGYEVINDTTTFKKGTLVYLSKQDYNSCPQFTDRITGQSHYVHWSDLKKLNSKINSNEKINTNTDLIVPRTTAVVERGCASRGTTLAGPTQEIRLGS